MKCMVGAALLCLLGGAVLAALAPPTAPRTALASIFRPRLAETLSGRGTRMGRRSPRQNSTIHSEAALRQAMEDEWLDALVVNGADPGAAHRARVRALNTARQRAEEGAVRLSTVGLKGGAPLALTMIEQAVQAARARWLRAELALESTEGGVPGARRPE